MIKKYKYVIVALVLFMVVGVVCLLVKSRFKSIKDANSRWTLISIDGGPMNGSWDISIDDYGDGLKLDNWDLPSKPEWIGGFRAAKGMSGLSYDEFRSHVSSKVLEGMGLKSAEDFDKFRIPGGGLSPDFVIYKVVYFKHEDLEYTLVSDWNNKRGSRENFVKRVEADGRTKYLGDWVPLRKLEQGFVLITNEELAESGIDFFPYAYSDELGKIIENKKLIWDDVRKKYISP